MNNLNRHIEEQIIEDYENYTIVDELTSTQAVHRICKEWDMSAMEVNDILVKYEKEQMDIDNTGDLGELL